VATRRTTAPKNAEADPDDSTGHSFEDSIRRLGEIVETLEGGELPLEESLRLFEEGVKLARTSQATLDRAERRVEELLSIDEDGHAVTREIDVE
jgi:exodeoxyribonuclease VII small subunit